MKKRIRAIWSYVLIFLGTIATIFYLSSSVAPSVASTSLQDAGTFAIYRLDSDVSGTNPVTFNLKQCSERNSPIISTEDILTYTKNTHELELTQPAYDRVQKLFGPPIPSTGVPFIACVGKQPIYVGAFWSPLSSRSFDGVVIMQPMSTQKQPLQIALGYISPFASVDLDPRADARIMKALDAAGKLKASPSPLSCVAPWLAASLPTN